MRTKLLFFFFLLMLLQVNMSTSAMVLKDAHRIMLKDIKASGSHRSMPVLPTAFIDGSLLSVDFLSAVTSAAVTVRNSATGEGDRQLLSIPCEGIFFFDIPGFIYSLLILG